MTEKSRINEISLDDLNITLDQLNATLERYSYQNRENQLMLEDVKRIMLRSKELLYNIRNQLGDTNVKEK